MSAALAYHPEPHAPAEDEPRVEAAAFVLALRGRGVSDLGVLRAMETVRREVFAPRRYADLARQDVALPLACGETMTAPATVALMLAALGVRPGQRILEIGTGSGYVTALLASMGAAVQSLERRFTLAESAWYRLKAAGYASACDLDCRDGLSIDESSARFDRILLNGTVASVPASLTSRLAPGGRLACGIARQTGGSDLLLVARDSGGALAQRIGAPLRLARLFQPTVVGPATEA